MLTCLSRVSFWCAAIAAGLALLGPAAHARLLTVLSVLAGVGSFACWRLALREPPPEPDGAALPLPTPLGAASLLDAAARLVACCVGAPTLDAALFGVAAVLKGELGARAVPVYRVEAVDAHQVTVVEARPGAVGASTVKRLLRLDDGALGQAVARRRVSGRSGQAWAVPVEQGERCVALLLVDGLAMSVDDEALSSLLELAHVELSRRACLGVEPQATEAASRARRRLLAAVSDALRLPLSDLLGARERLLGTALDPSQRRCAQALARCGAALQGTLDDLRDLAAIEAGGLVLAPSDFALRGMAEDLLDTLAPQAHDQGLELCLRVDAGLPDVVRADPVRLHQVLRHLVCNALRFTERGEVLVDLRPGAAGEAPALQVSVRDSGVGIAHERLPGLFDAGAGLGLNLTHRRVALMGGRLEARSSPGQGTEFRFGLPLQALSAGRHESPAPLPQLGGRVLVVEDNRVMQDVIGQMLGALGCERHLASSGAEGLQALGEARFDLVLMDIQRPGLDGIEALAPWRRGDSAPDRFMTPPGTPVIAVTACGHGDDPQRWIELGFDDCLPKPLHPPQLHAMLTRHLRPHAPVTPDDTHAPGAAAGPATAVVLDAEALGRLRELDPKGDNHLMERVLKAFETSVARLMPQLQAARLSGKYSDIRHVAHTLKSSSASIGALRLSQLCADIEAQVRLEHTEGLDAKVGTMAAEVDIVLKALRQLMESNA